MGWWEEAVNTVSNAVEGGVKSTVQILTVPLQVAADVVQGGGVDAIGERLYDTTKRTASAVVVNQSGGLIPLANTDLGQRVLDNRSVDMATFGISGDYAGYSRAAMQGQAGNQISREDLDDSFRLGVKAGTVGLGAALYGTSGVTTANYAGAQALQGGIKSGNYASVVSQLTGVPTGIINQIVPNNSTMPTMPSRNPTSVGITDPWTFGGTTYNQGGTLGGNENLIYVAAAAFAVIGIAAAVARRKK